MRRRLALATAVLALGLGLGWLALSPRPATSAIEGEEASIYEALFRDHLGRRAAKGLPGHGAFFLSIKGKDPPAAFLDRFAGGTWPVRKGSLCSAGGGVLISASGIERLPEGRIKVLVVEVVRSRLPCNFFLLSESGGGSNHTLVRKGGRWVVEKVEGVFAFCG